MTRMIQQEISDNYQSIQLFNQTVWALFLFKEKWHEMGPTCSLIFLILVLQTKRSNKEKKNYGIMTDDSYR